MTQHERAGFTPAPWTFADDLGEIQGNDGDALVAYPAVDTSSRCGATALTVPCWDEYLANGALLAAAPDLLAALILLRDADNNQNPRLSADSPEYFSRIGRAMAAADAAIARALGEEG